MEPEVRALDLRVDSVRNDLIEQMGDIEDSFWSDIRIVSLRKQIEGNLLDSVINHNEDILGGLRLDIDGVRATTIAV